MCAEADTVIFLRSAPPALIVDFSAVTSLISARIRRQIASFRYRAPSGAIKVVSMAVRAINKMQMTAIAVK